jgi:beta-glucosidase
MLPYTIAILASDFGNSIQSGRDNFAEGVFIDYKPFGKTNIAPRYEFEFGLYECLSSTVMGGLVWELIRVAYTTFNDTNISITGSPTSGATSGTIVPGGCSSLFDTAATVTAQPRILDPPLAWRLRNYTPGFLRLRHRIL